MAGSKNKRDNDVIVASESVEPRHTVLRSRTGSNATLQERRNRHSSSSSSSAHSSNHKKTQKGLRSNKSTTNEATPAPTKSEPRSRHEKKHQSGLNGTKFRPNVSSSESGPGAHRASTTPIQEQGMASAPPTVSASQDGVVEVAVAHLVNESDFDEEAIRQKAEQDAEKRLMKDVPRAEVVVESPEKNTSKQRRWVVLLLLFLILTVTAVASTVVATRRGKAPVSVTLAPVALAPSGAPSPTEVPSFMPSEPFTNDFCQGARELEGENVWFSSTTDATLDEGFATCGDIRNNGRGQWLQVWGDNAWLRVHTCNEDTNYDTQLSVYTARAGEEAGLGQRSWACRSATCVAGNDQFCGDQSYVQWFGEEDALYWVLIHGYRHYTGNFGLEVLEEKNEVCQGAVNVSQPIFQQESGVAKIETSMARAVPIDQEQLPQCRFEPKPSGVGIWFTYDGRNNIPKLSVGNELNLAVYSGSCDRLLCVALTEQDKLVDEEETYYILVYAEDPDSISLEALFHLRFAWAEYGFFFPPQQNSYCEEVQGNPEYLLAPGQAALEGETTSNAWILNSQPVSDIGSCGDSVFFTSDGLWYSVVGTGRPMTVSTCRNQSGAFAGNNSREEGFDTQISVFSGSCDSLTCIDGNDQFCGDQSAVSWFTEEGVVYSVLVHGYGTRYGVFEVSYGEIDTFADSPSCEGAIPILADGTSVLGTTAFSEFANPVGYCGFGGNTNAGAGSWFKAVGTGQTWTASTCSSNTDFTARVSVYAGTSCSDLVCVDSTVSPCGQQNAVTWKTISNQEYYILVHGKDSSSQGNFVMRLEETASNDECDGAIGPLDADASTYFSSTRSATFDDAVPSCSAASGRVRSPAGRGVFYSVMGSGTNMTATTCFPYTNFDAQLSVYFGSCDDLRCVSVQTTDCPVTSNNVTQLGKMVTWASMEDELYYLLIQGNDEAIGNFALQLHAS